MIKRKGHSVNLKFINGIPYVKIVGKFCDIRDSDFNWDLFMEMKRLKGLQLMIVDISDLQGRPGIVSTYYHVREFPYYDLFNKIAIVDRIENRDYYSFHENTANNAGHNIRYFNETNEAISWLKGDTLGSSSERFVDFPLRGALASNWI